MNFLAKMLFLLALGDINAWVWVRQATGSTPASRGLPASTGAPRQILTRAKYLNASVSHFISLLIFSSRLAARRRAPRAPHSYFLLNKVRSAQAIFVRAGGRMMDSEESTAHTLGFILDARRRHRLCAPCDEKEPAEERCKNYLISGIIHLETRASHFLSASKDISEIMALWWHLRCEPSREKLRRWEFNSGLKKPSWSYISLWSQRWWEKISPRQTHKSCKWHTKSHQFFCRSEKSRANLGCPCLSLLDYYLWPVNKW
jgi:hypothetical protein